MLQSNDYDMIKRYLELVFNRMLQMKTKLPNLDNENVYLWIHKVHETATSFGIHGEINKDVNKHMIGMLESGFELLKSNLFYQNRRVYDALVELKDDCITMLQEIINWYTNPRNCSQPLSDDFESYASEEDYRLIFDGVKKSKDEFNKSIKDTKFLLHPDKNRNESAFVRNRREEHLKTIDNVKNEIRSQCNDWWNRENISM